MFGPSKQSLSLLVQGLISFSAKGLIGGAVRDLRWAAAGKVGWGNATKFLGFCGKQKSGLLQPIVGKSLVIYHINHPCNLGCLEQPLNWGRKD